jgi:hypothetical protein
MPLQVAHAVMTFADFRDETLLAGVLRFLRVWELVLLEMMDGEIKAAPSACRYVVVFRSVSERPNLKSSHHRQQISERFQGLWRWQWCLGQQ